MKPTIALFAVLALALASAAYATEHPDAGSPRTLGRGAPLLSGFRLEKAVGGLRKLMGSQDTILHLPFLHIEGGEPDTAAHAQATAPDAAPLPGSPARATGGGNWGADSWHYWGGGRDWSGGWQNNGWGYGGWGGNRWNNRWDGWTRRRQ